MLSALGSGLVLAGTPAGSSNTGLLWGRVVDADGRAVPQASIVVKGEDLEEDVLVATDADGWYSVVGLRPGMYSARASAGGFAAHLREHIAVEPHGRVAVTFILGKEAALGEGSSRIREDILPATRTVIPAAQIERLPTGLSLNSLIENQDSVATTNRIDVGGMQEADPVLFSSRGASSWTQNVYLLNGLDITEPYFGGTPLVVPDILGLRFTALFNAAAPIQALTPGAYFDLTPREGTAAFHGGGWGFYLDKTFSTTNITPALQAEGMMESSSFNRLMDLNLHLSGPFGDPRWRYFTSWTSQSAGRDLGDYEPEDESRLYSGLIHIVREGEDRRLRFFWTGQNIVHPSAGAGRSIPPETTVHRTEWRNVLQIVSESRPGSRSGSRYGVSLGLENAADDLQPSAVLPAGLELFRNIPSGTAAASTRDDRARLAAYFDGRTFFRNVARTHHLLEYGAQIQYAGADSEATVPGNLRLHFLDGRPIEVLEFDSPFRHREWAGHLDAYLQETLILENGLSLSLGFHGVGSSGWSAAGSIRRLNLSPRFALQIPLSRMKTSALRITAARYFGTLPLSYLTWGNPGAPGSQAFRWDDANGDRLFTADEKDLLLRREGPRYGALDPDLRIPSTDELTVSITHDFGRGWMMSLAGFLRETRNLVETINIGVPPSAYIPRTILDLGDDRIPGSIDDLRFTVFDQRPETLGADAYFLSNPGRTTRASFYQGLDFVLFKRPTDRFLFFLGMTATHAVQTNGPGNTALENDDGVIGPLYDNPNAALNAEGRPRFDRAYTIRFGLSQDLPFGLRFGAVGKYYDGQPFTRTIIVEGLTQGPFTIQAHPRGVARYEFNMTVDLRLEKRFRFPFGTIRMMADVFNVFNQNLALVESEWTRPEFPLRYATEIQSPRVWRLGLNLEF